MYLGVGFRAWQNLGGRTGLDENLFKFDLFSNESRTEIDFRMRKGYRTKWGIKSSKRT